MAVIFFYRNLLRQKVSVSRLEKNFVKMRYEKWVAENSAVLLRQKVSVSWLEKNS